MNRPKLINPAILLPSVLLFASLYLAIQFSDPRLHRIADMFSAVIGGTVFAILLALKKNEERLRQSEARFRTLVGSMEDIVFTLDCKQRHTGVFGKWLEKYALPPEALLGKNSAEILGPQAARVHEDANRRALAGESVVYEWSRESAEGVIHIQTSLSPLHDSKGKITGLVGVGRDITESKLAQEALQREKNLSELIIDNIPAGVAFFDRDIILRRCNRAYASLIEKYTPYTAEQAVGMSYFDYVPGSRAQIEDWFLRVRDSRAVETRMEFKLVIEQDGQDTVTYWDTSLAPLLTLDGQVEGILLLTQDATARKLAEAAQRQSEQRYRTLVETMDEGLGMIDTEGKITFANRRFCEMVGYTLAELAGQPASILLDDENHKIAAAEWARRKTGEAPHPYELTLCKKGGEKITTITSPQPVYAEDGHFAGSFGVFMDITERKRTEEALRQSQAVNQALLSAVPDLLFRIDQQGVILDFKAGKQEELYAPPEAFLGKPVGAVLPAQVAEEILARAAYAVATVEMQTFEYRLSTSIDEERYWEARVAPTGQGEVLAIIRDVTQRTLAEQALQESEQRFRNLFENAPLPIFEADFREEQWLLRVNQRAQEVYGWDPGEFMGLTTTEILPENEVAGMYRIIDRLLQGELISTEMVHLKRDGAAFPVKVFACPYSSTEPGRAIMMVRDVTQEKARLSEELAIAEERRRIAREIHDGLAQDLAALRVRMGVWHDLIDQDPERMHAELEAMKDILGRNIREVRRSIFALRPVPLDELGFFPALRQFTQDFGEQNGLQVGLMVEGPQKRLPAHLEPALFRLVQEALNNAGKHASAQVVWITLDLNAPGRIGLTIQDDGQGFDTQDLELAPRNGHVGLCQMRERVEACRGRFSIYSQPGQGTQVRVELPV